MEVLDALLLWLAEPSFGQGPLVLGIGNFRMDGDRPTIRSSGSMVGSISASTVSGKAQPHGAEIDG